MRALTRVLLVAGVLGSASCTRINPPPDEALLRSREQAAMGRATAETGVAPGVPPLGPVVTPVRASVRSDRAGKGERVTWPDGGPVPPATPAPSFR